MDYKQALEYINGASWRGSRLGLERISELLARLGNPQSELKFVHVAGTNGKGSICKVFNKRIVNIVFIDHIIKTDGIFHRIQLSPAHAEFHDINKLIFYSALFKITLGLFCVKAFAFAEDLNIHSAFSITLRILFLKISQTSCSE